MLAQSRGFGLVVVWRCKASKYEVGEFSFDSPTNRVDLLLGSQQPPLLIHAIQQTNVKGFDAKYMLRGRKEPG